jgi:hypothetical protein
MAVLILLLLTAATRVDLVDEVYTIPPAEWRYVSVELKQTPVLVHCHFEGTAKGTEVRVALLSHTDLERLRADEPHGFLAATRAQSSGEFSFALHSPGDYAVVVDNREQHAPARVHLRVSLDFNLQREPAVGYLPARKRLIVILVSFAVFFGIVTWSARKLLGAMQR